MKTTIDKILTYLLTPASWLYGAGVWVRNKCFDAGILPQSEFGVPVIGVGNLVVGGSGKTPHSEFIVSQLCGSYKVAVLSRGYRRSTKGFIVANSKSTPDSIGDEPWQIYNKYGSRAKVAVCESRKKGISELLKLYPDLDVVILDDSFQHRWVRPQISVLLMEYSSPMFKDKLLPLGRLREPYYEMNRADKIIITKCPDGMSPMDMRNATKELNVMKFQKIYFSTFTYEQLQPVFADDAPYAANLASLTERDSAYLLTGIAHPRYFVRHFKAYPFRKKVAHFPDHHNFTRMDLLKIAENFKAMKGERKIIITTEKDAVRLLHNPYFPQELKPYIFYQPIRVKMLPGIYGHENNLMEDLLDELKLRSPGDDDTHQTSETSYGGYNNHADSEASTIYDADTDSHSRRPSTSAGYNSFEAQARTEEVNGEWEYSDNRAEQNLRNPEDTTDSQTPGYGNHSGIKDGNSDYAEEEQPTRHRNFTGSGINWGRAAADNDFE